MAEHVCLLTGILPLKDSSKQDNWYINLTHVKVDAIKHSLFSTRNLSGKIQTFLFPLTSINQLFDCYWKSFSFSTAEWELFPGVVCGEASSALLLWTD